MVKLAFKSFSFAWKGLKTTWREEHNFRIEILAAILVIFSMIYFQFSFIESVFCIIAITIVLSAEIVNTVVEDLCNFVEPNNNEVIGKIKDTMGAFVLVSALGSFIIGLIVFYNHFLI